MSVSSLAELKVTFHNKIIPLLQEYFFGDLAKMGLVIGKGFFKDVEKQDENIFADFYDNGVAEFADREIYNVKNIAKMADPEFNTAINLLLKK
jgi:5-methylcytosine-specific restriction protein B